MDIRTSFSSLKSDGNTRDIFLDGPAGTQVPDTVIKAISDYYLKYNSNTHGTFRTTIATDELIEKTRQNVSDFLGAKGPHNISFGQNMTTLTYSLARGISRILIPGDEILITQLDHEANRGPWLSLRENGIIVNEIKVNKDGLLDYEDMRNKINQKTRLVAMGWASNLTGTVNNVRLARKLTYESGAWLLLDAVHYAPHFNIDVQAIGCDFLLCSAYKFYGPHVGILYSKTGLLDRLQTDRLRTTNQYAPYCIETGTLNHAALAGVLAAIQFIADMGKGPDNLTRIVNAMNKISHYEKTLGQKLYDGIAQLPKAHIIGPGYTNEQRSPTISFQWSGVNALEVCTYLSARNIFTWGGHFYAIRASEKLGLMEFGGVTRMGVSAYTSEDDIDKTLEALQSL